jgi:hypothetical protein
MINPPSLNTGLALVALLLTVSLPSYAEAQSSVGELTKFPKLCTRPDVKAPLLRRNKLGAEYRRWIITEYESVWVDIDGNGYCDYVVRAPFARRSRTIESLTLPEVIRLGSKKGWRTPSPRVFPRSDDNDLFATDIVLEHAQFLFPVAGGAPYLIGVLSWKLNEEYENKRCLKGSTIVRWDTQKDTLVAVSEQEQKEVMSQYSQKFETSC